MIKSIDKDAFITQAQVNGVYGRGFDEIKLRMSKPHAQGPESADLDNHLNQMILEVGSGRVGRWFSLAGDSNRHQQRGTTRLHSAQRHGVVF